MPNKSNWAKFWATDSAQEAARRILELLEILMMKYLYIYRKKHSKLAVFCIKQANYCTVLLK